MFSTAPFIHFSWSNCPSGDLGVWHSWQRATSSVRYFPRAILPDCAQPWQTNRQVETSSSLQTLIEANGTTKGISDFGCRISGGFADGGRVGAEVPTGWLALSQ